MIAELKNRQTNGLVTKDTHRALESRKHIKR